MPIYEYRCTRCEHELEKLQKINDPPLSTCPVCNEEALRKKVSAAGFRLKGGGWYETDFKSDKRRNIAGDSSTESSKGGSGEPAKAESKAGSKAESKAGSKAESKDSTGSAKPKAASSSSD